MPKSLSDTAAKVLAGEKKPLQENANADTLKPGSKVKEAPKKLTPNGDQGAVEDLGPAIVTPTAAASGPDKAADTVAKDGSKSSKASVGPEGRKTLRKEEDETVEDTEMVSEEEEIEVEMTEELESFIANCLEEGMTEEEIDAAIEENFELVVEDTDKKDDDDEDKEDCEDEDKKDVKEEIEIPEVDVSKDVEALFAGEELSEDFKTKATTIFESAIKVRLEHYKAQLEEAFEKRLTEEVEAITTDLTEKTDQYLNYVVEEWVGANEVAIESGLRTELTEDFISGLKNLFKEHYIDVPEDKIDILEGLGQKVDEQEEKINELIEQNSQLMKTLNEQTKVATFYNATDGLTDVQTEQLRELANKVDFVNEEDYAKKVHALRESYFPKNTKVSTELEKVDMSDSGKMIVEDSTDSMSIYKRALGRFGTNPQ